MRWRVSYLAACDAGLKPCTAGVKFQHSSTCCSTPQQQQQLVTNLNAERIHLPSSQHPVETLIMKTPLASFQLEVTTPSEGFLPSQQDEVTEDTQGLFSSYQQQRGTNRPRNISAQRPLSVDASSNYSESEVLEGSTPFNGPCLMDYASHHVSNKMLCLLSRCSPFSSDHLKDFSVFDPKWVHGMQWLDRAHRICTLEMVLDALPLTLNDLLRHSGCSASSLRNWSWQNICTPSALKISNVLLRKLGMVPATSHESTQPYGFVYMQVQRKYEDMLGSEMDVEAVRAVPVQIFRLAVNTELAESKWRDLNALANLKGMTQINALLHLRIYLSSCVEWMMTERRMEDSSWIHHGRLVGAADTPAFHDDEVASHDDEIMRLIHEEENDLVMREEVIVQLSSQQRESQANRRRVLRAGWVFRNRRCRPMLPRLITGPLIMEGEAEIFPLQVAMGSNNL
ncbi:hypothetical protein CEUSTIGMA_g10365.t1 [Chlamydomonas eustigma]|uniref:Uncharacterized protein n=1 Tax=Chlamydomonas eustigma TaxID=1157962 RepID=A0A250XIM6_9CHLO|nr:hypothetical protein CEUSTIGMA_g10365.t1 [Chlamydomonas eustigma]|eukprot:GAX82938.1 hypothetical protein CEUSTIGMA_g10365.t1 [Chlamydomonas eustigma]